MMYVGIALIVVGGIFGFIQAIRLLIIAFKESAVQGLLCLLLGPYILIYVITRWENCKGSFLNYLGAIAIVIVGVILLSMGGGGSSMLST